MEYLRHRRTTANISVLAIAFASLAAFGCTGRRHTPADPPKAAAQPKKQRLPGEIVPELRMRDAYPIRLGMVALRGIGDASDPQELSADLGVKLGPEGENWIASHCDVAALDARCLTPEIYPAIRKSQKLFTGLVYTYASSIYDQPGHRGSVGVWQPAMAAWALKTTSGAPEEDTDPGGHWMDCANTSWQSYWAAHAEQVARQFHADGVVAADLPVGNTFVRNDLARHAFSDKVDATSSFLAAVHKPEKFLVVPSSVAFDELVGRPMLPVEPKRAEPHLIGRCWDEFDKLYDGVYAEGWVQLPWQPEKLTENEWEVQLEAADRVGKAGDVFIAPIAYSSPDELEYGLASFLLIVHHEGRAAVQPMPLDPGEFENAGTSLKVMMSEYRKYQTYFDARLGVARKERKYVPVTIGMAWRRSFENGDVYVNSSDSRAARIELGGAMLRVNGEKVTQFTLEPHSGVILLKIAKSL